MTIEQSPRQPLRRIIGLTGGIAMGKTMVSDYLATMHQLPVLDADVYAREAVEPGTPILQQIVDRYGSGVLHSNGGLDRMRLGDIVFNSSAERLWLEQQIHPYVRDRLVEAVQQLPPLDIEPFSIVVMVIPLLFEARMTDLVTESWVVVCSEEQQIERLMRRDALTLEQAQVRINSQMAIQKKTSQATVVLENRTTPAELFRQVDYYLVHAPQGTLGRVIN